MLLRFATKRDINGNRHYLAIDTDGRTYSQRPSTIIFNGDFAEVKKKDLEQIKQKAIDDKYKAIEAL